MKRVVVIGAGISGLSTAWWLHRAGADVRLLEKESYIGGTMRSVRDGGWLIETGPNSALETTPLFGEMFDALGISGERIYANSEADRRYILRNGKLHALPMSPPAFLKSRLWTISGKLRLLKEPFVKRAPVEETVAEFVERRLGREFLDYAINPFVAGVYAGNPEQLSVRAAFPKLYALEEKYGGLVKGMVKGAGERKRRAEKAKDRARMFAFKKGMQTFPEVIGTNLHSGIELSVRVNAIVRSLSKDNEAPRYAIQYETGGFSRSVEADVVILSVPAYAASRLISDFSPALAGKLSQVYYPPVAEVFLGYKESQVGRALDGFGYLIPAREKRSILGTIWTSTIFPDRAPKGFAAFTTFVGGSRQPELASRNDADLLALVERELQGLMGMKGKPAYTRLNRWEKAIPQYNLGYLDVVKMMDEFEVEHSGLFLCSNFRGGIAVGDCVMSAKKTADKVLEYLKRRDPGSPPRPPVA